VQIGRVDKPVERDRGLAIDGGRLAIATLPPSRARIAARQSRSRRARHAPRLSELTEVPTMTSMIPARDSRPMRAAPPSLHFPESAEMPESTIHLQLRTLLFHVLRGAFGERGAVGSEQFVYWDAADPKRCLSPDVFVRLDSSRKEFGSWKTWEHGAPELAVEIVSDSDRGDLPWEQKLARYRSLGARELVRFDPGAEEGRRLQAWDRDEIELVERAVEDDRTPCRVLGCHFVVVVDRALGPVLRPSRDPHGRELFPTDAEKESRAREAAERRVAELEAELARRPG
jgi:Uma2 family endonuclease